MGGFPADILKKAARGDLDAFEQVYKEFSGFVYNVAYRFSRNPAEAEEVSQDVFMKIYHGLKSFQFRSAFRTWVYRITVNTALNHRKQALKSIRNRVDYDSVVEVLPGKESVDISVSQNDDRDRLNALLEELPPEYKACIILRELEGLSYLEISQSLNVPLNTVRSRLKRARQALLEKGQKEVV